MFTCFPRFHISPDYLRKLVNTELGLYLLAACKLMNFVFFACWQARAVSLGSRLAYLGFSGFMPVSSVLILVALGLVLRRAIPIIEESRTLV